MKLPSAIVSALVSLNPFSAWGAKTDDGVAVKVINSTEEFTSFINNDIVLVEFFAPWCGHCQKLAPEYETAAKELKGGKDAKGSKEVLLGSVDCTVQKEVCSKHDIKGYPTLKIFRKGVGQEYQGPRVAAGIVHHMTKQSEPAVSTVDEKGLEEFSKRDNVVFVAKLVPGSKEAELYRKVAEEFRNDYTFGQVDAKSPSLEVYKKFDEGRVVYEGKFDKEPLTAFIYKESTPLVAEIGPENYANYMKAGLPLAYFFYENEEQKTTFTPALREAVGPHKGRLNAVYINAGTFGEHAGVLNLEKKWPGFVIHEPGKDHKFPFTGGALSADSLKTFVKSFTDGKLKPTFKSEPVPTKQDGPVRDVVHNSFNDIVLDEKKDVLLEIYAPWCGACKNLAPTYDQLAEKYAKASDKIVIAKFNGTENDLPDTVDLKLQHFPTIVLFKANKDKKTNSKASMVEYRGGPSLDALIDFISTEAVNKVTVEKDTPKDTSPKQADGDKVEL